MTPADAPAVVLKRVREELIEKVKGKFIYTREDPGDCLAACETDSPPTQDMVGKLVRVTVTYEVLP